ncbi:MAG: DUF4198 domain-containing protein [Acidobacteria bacterium]|nr:DUF4198 domain-containing protein [Acidobacteriota bacterium]
MKQARARLAFGLALLGAGSLSAHDLWIEPSAFMPAPGTRLAVRLFIGQLFQGDVFPRDPKYLLRFAVIGGGGEAPIPGVPDTDPAGFLVTGRPGLYELVYASSHAAVELEAAKFESYLAEEGLEKISALRARSGRSAAKAKEIYSRCAKSLIAVGEDAGSGHDRVLGLTLELIPEQNPYTLAAGQELPVRLLYRGQPLAGAKVAAVPKDQPGRQVAARTDAQGRVRLRLGSPGVWLIKAVHMIAAPPGSGADWESFWASLTFALPAHPLRQAGRGPG